MRALCLLAVAVSLGLGCRESTKAAPPPTPAGPATTPATTAKVNVRVDRRVELLAVIERLAGAREYATTRGTPYLDAVDRYFAPYAEHAAVAAARALRAAHGIGYDAPMSFAVHLDDAYVLRPATERTTLDARWREADPDAFAAAVRAFATDTKFDGFFADHAAYFRTLESTLRGLLEREQVVPYFERLFGPTNAAMLVVASPIAGQRNFGPRTPDTYVQILGVNGPAGELVVNDILRALLVHELGHAYVNPLFTAHQAELEPAATKLYGGVADAMRMHAYADPMTVAHESGVRAITYNYLSEVHGAAAAGATLRKDRGESFAWTVRFAEVMQPGPELLANRMPAIVERFAAIAAEYEHGVPAPGFLGPVDAVHSPASIWVIAPTPAIDEYARGVHAKLKKANAIVTVGRDEPPAGHDLVAFGTPGDNAVIAEVVKRAGFTVEPGRIAVGTKAFTGDGLVLIACWPRAGDATHGVAIYTAARTEDVVGISGVRHGSTDWLVARTTAGTVEVLGAGDFVHAGPGDWRLP